MATVTIERTPESGPVPKGAEFTLEAKVEGGDATAYQWQRDGEDISGATNSEYRATASDPSAVGEFKVTAIVDGNEVTATTTIVLGDAPVASPSTEPGAETPPQFHLLFALVSAVVAFAVGALLFFDLAKTAGEIVKADWLGERGDTALAVTVAVPMTVIGGVLVVVGAWMAVVEWRGRFAGATQSRGIEIKPGEIIAAIGNLRGAALVLVVGAIVMLGSAWIAKSASDDPQSKTPTTTTTAPAPATTTGTEPAPTAPPSTSTTPGGG